MKKILVTAFAVSSVMPIFIWPNTATASDFLTKEEAIERALKNAPMLNAARENITATEGMVRQAGAKPNPLIGAEVENLSGTGPYTSLDRSQLTVSYSQTIERGNKRHHRVRIASEQKKIAITQWHINRLDIIADVEKAFLDVLAAQARVKNLQKQVTIFEDIAQTINTRVHAGKDSQLAAQNASIQTLTSQNSLEEALLILDTRKLALASLWQSNDTVFAINEEVLFNLPSALTPVDAETILGGPDISLWTLREGASTASLGLEKAKAVQDPTFSVGLRYHQDSTDVAAIVGVSIPLAWHNTNKGNIARAKAEARKSQYERRSFELQLQRKLLLAEKSQLTAFTQVRRLKANLKAAEETKTLIQKRLSKGAVSYLEIFAAQSLTANIEQQLINAYAEFHSAGAIINRLTAKYHTDELPITPSSGPVNLHEGQ